MKPKNHPRPKTNPSRICKRSTSILFAGNPLPAWIYDLKSLRFLEVNDSALRQYGYTRDEFLSLTLNDIRQTDCTTGSDTLRGATEEIDDAWISTRKDGTKIYAQIHENDIRFRKRRARYVVIDDITERRYVQSELLRLAHYDALTGLPNRILMEQRMQQVLEGASKRGHRAGIICLDLDRFKEVNDWYGHEVGDECLRQVGIILTRRLRGMDVVARTGGGEFTILLGEVDSVASAGIVAKALSLAFASPVELDGYGVTLRPSLGVAVYPDHGTDGLELSRLAEAAMYRAKRAGGNRHETVAANLPIITAENAGVETHMRQMLLKGGFQLHYQLQYSMTGEVRGMEALLRLPHPKLGYVSPDRFIPIAEDNGLIHPLGKWVIEEACRQLKRWNSHQASPVRIAVNVSPLQLMRPDFVTDVKQAISLSGIDPAWLEMEITERVMLNFSEIAKRMEQLAALGIRFAVDDFGTGYSSLQHLNRLPISTLKIDRSFIQQLSESSRSYSIVKAILAMAHSLHMEVIAEGVENEDQMRLLRKLHCTCIQGFLLSRPSPPEVIETILEKLREAALPILRKTSLEETCVRRA